jgi:hypothetical protein
MRSYRSRRRLKADLDAAVCETARWKWRTARALERAEEAEAAVRRLEYRLELAVRGPLGDTVPLPATEPTEELLVPWLRDGPPR